MRVVHGNRFTSPPLLRWQEDETRYEGALYRKGADAILEVP